MKAGNIGLAVFTAVVIAFLLLPVVIVIPMSFSGSSFFEIIPTNPSLAQYYRLFADPAWMEVLTRSLQIAVGVMCLATLIGTLAALGIARLPARLQSFAEAAFISPQIIPSVVIAVSSYFLFARLGLIGSTGAIVIAHTLIALPFVVVLVGSRLQSIDPELALASASLGADPARTFFRIVAPQLALTFVGAGIVAFHVSFDEVVLALFLTGARNKTLPVKLWESILFEVTPILPAISTLVLVIPIVIVVTVVLLRKRPV
jgi:putative spermidine/putrescine transport system permease protein